MVIGVAQNTRSATHMRAGCNFFGQVIEHGVIEMFTFDCGILDSDGWGTKFRSADSSIFSFESPPSKCQRTKSICAFRNCTNKVLIKPRSTGRISISHHSAFASQWLITSGTSYGHHIAVNTRRLRSTLP